MTSPEWVLVTNKVIQALEELGVEYVIGGSIASIIHGILRTTVDCDLVADLGAEHIERLTSALEGEFYIEPESIREAISHRTCFNLIHLHTMFKIDIFIPKTRSFEQSQLARRVQKVVSREPELTAWIATAEDIILAKLEWFRLGNEVSERQWRDILGVLKMQSGQLDTEYLRRMASDLRVSDLLERAIEDSML